MDSREKEAAGGGHLDDLVELSEASIAAHVHLHGLGTTVSELRRNEMAAFLVKLSTVFVCSGAGQAVRELRKEELSGGSFVDGGRRVTYGDALAARELADPCARFLAGSGHIKRVIQALCAGCTVSH